MSGMCGIEFVCPFQGQEFGFVVSSEGSTLG
jgi:hypothetical protein